MDIGHFYFLKDEYFERFQDPYLMQNKESVGGQKHGRPCFYSFLDNKTNLFWMIPISSNISKFEKIRETKIKKYGRCDTIFFGSIFGKNKVFLVQNMCPSTFDYIESEYVGADRTHPVLDGAFANSIIVSAKRVLNLQRMGARIILPDVLKIEKELLSIGL